jgi:hypothetical protein
VIGAASCPAASSFWDALPGGWLDVRDVIPVDGHIDECITGHPEQLMVTVLGSVGALTVGDDAPNESVQPGRHLRPAPLSGAGNLGRL